MTVTWNIALALLLLIVAHTTPWAAARLAGNRWATPLDLGLTAGDGKRLLGDHKTWRGLASGTLACGLAGAMTGFGALLGCGFGALALLGDALSSLVKRRLSLSAGSELPGLDQLPEALLPVWVFAPALGLTPLHIAGVVLGFLLLDMAATRIRHRP